MDERGSVPMSPPPPAPERMPTGRHASLSEDDAARALRISIANREMLGRPPNGAIRGDEGTGMWAVLHGLQTAVAGAVAEVQGLRADMAADREARAKRGGWLGQRVDKIVDYLLLAAVAAAVAWFVSRLR